MILKHRHLVGFAKLTEHGEVRATTYVGCHADFHGAFLIFSLPVFEFSVAQKQIARRAMGHSASVAVERLPLLFANDTAMCQHGIAVDKAVIIIYVGIVFTLGEQLCHPIDFALHFVKMSVHIHTLVEISLIKFAGKLKLKWGRGGCESRYNCVKLSAAMVPFLHKLLCQDD